MTLQFCGTCKRHYNTEQFPLYDAFTGPRDDRPRVEFLRLKAFQCRQCGEKFILCDEVDLQAIETHAADHLSDQKRTKNESLG